jgi:hypothetical protein
MNDERREPLAGADRFHTTRWSVVLIAGDRGTPEAREALATLFEAYWYPLYSTFAYQMSSKPAIMS